MNNINASFKVSETQLMSWRAHFNLNMHQRPSQPEKAFEETIHLMEAGFFPKSIEDRVYVLDGLRCAHGLNERMKSCEFIMMLLDKGCFKEFVQDVDMRKNWAENDVSKLAHHALVVLDAPRSMLKRMVRKTGGIAGLRKLHNQKEWGDVRTLFASCLSNYAGFNLKEFKYWYRVGKKYQLTWFDRADDDENLWGQIFYQSTPEMAQWMNRFHNSRLEPILNGITEEMRASDFIQGYLKKTYQFHRDVLAWVNFLWDQGARTTFHDLVEYIDFESPYALPLVESLLDKGLTIDLETEFRNPFISLMKKSTTLDTRYFDLLAKNGYKFDEDPLVLENIRAYAAGIDHLTYFQYFTADEHWNSVEIKNLIEIHAGPIVRSYAQQQELDSCTLEAAKWKAQRRL